MQYLQNIFQFHIMTNLNIKFYYGVILNTISIIIGCTAINLVNDFPIWFNLTIIVLSTLLNIVENYLMLIIDLKRPKINWNSENDVFKKNRNITIQTISMLIITFFLIKTGLEIARGYAKTVGIYLGILIILEIGIDIYVHKNQVKLFEKIE